MSFCSNTSNIPWGAAPQLPLVYTPIAIQFVPPLLTVTPDTTDYSVYSLYITPPRSSRPGLNHYLNDPYTVQIPADGLLYMQMVPSDWFLPLGRYKVQYYKTGQSTPLDTQVWIVPSRPMQATMTELFTGNPIALPYTVWQVSSPDPSVSFTYENNMLTAIGASLVAGVSQFTVDYIPAVTLDQLIEYKPYGVGVDRPGWV